ncbi:helicase c2 [Desulfurispirillum indicum S5]|uniref:DNA 5'-3' helicase n=2 Tax=Desulfurispirillum TaxID=393029 RepID=E6W437_DESIS|nr:helicase c2 [Desulfurispirillum indicum S5]
MPDPQNTLMQSYFAPDGALAEVLPGYGFRQEQFRMVRCIEYCLDRQESAIIEAGTGTGKSLAYLIPSIVHALRSKVRILISTNTINLQEQLLEKDLPVVRALGLEFNAALIKGRGNYLCQRKLDSLPELDSPLLLPDAVEDAYEQLYHWLGRTREGSRNDLDFALPPSVWEEVCSEGDTCQHGRCAFYRDCFFFRSRREAQNAHVLIVNHALLCSDLALRGLDNDSSGIIPAYGVAIIDEAHNLEDVASSHLGMQFHFRGFLKNLSRIYFLRGSRESGKLLQLAQSIVRRELPPTSQEEMLVRLEGVRQRISGFYGSVQVRAQRVLDELAGLSQRRIRKDSDYPQALLEFVFLCTEEGRLLLDQLQSAIGYAKILLEGDDLLQELSAYRSRLEGSISALEFFLRHDDPTHVRWFDVGRDNFAMVSAPLEVGPILAELLFSRVKSSFLTSATLVVENSFQYMRRSLGCQPRYELTLQSPFNYDENAVLIVPRLPDYQDEGQHQSAFSHLILDVTRTMGGGIFVLCTSYRRMNQLAAVLEGPMAGLGVNLYVQGSFARTELLRRYRENQPAVLLGVSSFWEGVDVKGEALQCVIIEKLPFPVPDTPLFQARCEAIDRAGGRSFWDLSVPKAVIRLKQGFGRLIRDTSDRGSCILCDNRIVNRRYGTIFLHSLPLKKHVFCEADEVARHLKFSIPTLPEH